MPIEIGSTIPWLDNWPVRRQLWAYTDSQMPGDELDLSDPIGRSLTVQWRDALGVVVLAYVEGELDFPATILQPRRGVVEVRPSGAVWDVLQDRQTYILEILAYGILYDESLFAVALPEPRSELLNGVEVYGAPRQIVELLGMVPGASVMVGVNLSGGWSLDPRGYWIKSIPADQQMFGFWVNDHYAPQVDYRDLALHGDRAWARLPNGETDTLYFKGYSDENLSQTYVETAYSRYALRCLQEATAEVERRTGQFFNLRRVYREVHRGLRRQRQLVTQNRPIQIDALFRLDALSFSRNVFRRYTEDDFLPNATYQGGKQVLHANATAGIITISSNVWDWWDWGNSVTADYGIGAFAYLPKGEANVEVTYVAGYKYLPADIDEAATNLAAMRLGIFFQQSLTQGLSGLNIGCLNLNFTDMFSKWFPSWQQSADRILEAYQHIEIEAF